MAFIQSNGPDITATQALKRLMDGNRRFVRGEARFLTVRKEILAELAHEQPPICHNPRVQRFTRPP